MESIKIDMEENQLLMKSLTMLKKFYISEAIRYSESTKPEISQRFKDDEYKIWILENKLMEIY